LHRTAFLYEMKPNKQRILSNQPVKPGAETKTKASKQMQGPWTAAGNGVIYRKTQNTEFQLENIGEKVNKQREGNVFKLIQFDDRAKHSRSGTTLINNNVQQTYGFLSALTNRNKRSTLKVEENEDKKLETGKSRESENVCSHTTDTMQEKLESVDLFFGAEPHRYWCLDCSKEVVSEVKMELPRTSV
jgi:hypothetical protein